MDPLQALVESLTKTLAPFEPWLIALVILNIVATFPLPGRGPRSSAKDPWRGFKFAARDTVMSHAGERCEAPEFLAWGRCGNTAVEVDHVFPHSKGGATVVANGQALCRHHNRRKANMNPPWWYILGLEKRRLEYYPDDADVRVYGWMTQEEYDARQAWLRKKAPRKRW